MTLDPDAIVLLPKWDAWTMDYAPDGRARIAHEQHLPHTYSTPETSANKASGDGWPLILRSGRTIARWESRYVTSALEVTITPFPGERIADAEIRPGFERIAAFLGSAAGQQQDGQQGKRAQDAAHMGFSPDEDRSILPQRSPSWFSRAAWRRSVHAAWPPAPRVRQEVRPSRRKPEADRSQSADPSRSRAGCSAHGHCRRADSRLP